METENRENDSCSTTCKPKFKEHWLGTSEVQITRKEVTMSSVLLNRRIRPTNTAVKGITRQQIKV